MPNLYTSPFGLRLIAANIAELSRALDEAPLAVCTFLSGRLLVTEIIQLPSRHVGGLARTPAAALTGGCCAGERLFRETVDRCGPTLRARLTAPPFIKLIEHFLIAPNRYGGDAGFHVQSSSASPVTAGGFGYLTFSPWDVHPDR